LFKLYYFDKQAFSWGTEGKKGRGEKGERRIFKEKMKYTLEASNV